MIFGESAGHWTANAMFKIDGHIRSCNLNEDMAFGALNVSAVI